MHYLHFLSFFLLCLPWGLSWILEAFFKYLATFGCLLLTQEHNRGDWTPGPGVGKASRMPGTPHLKEHTYIQSCASAMWVVSALQVSASLRISLWCPGVCCEWPCRTIGLQFRRVVRKSIKLCARGHRCLYVKMFSQGRCRFSSERSFTHLRKKQAWLPFQSWMRGRGSPFSRQTFNTPLLSAVHSTLFFSWGLKS